MKATIEVTVTLKVRTSAVNQHELEKLREIIHGAVFGKVQNLYKPIIIGGKQLQTDVNVESGIPFVEFNW